MRKQYYKSNSQHLITKANALLYDYITTVFFLVGSMNMELFFLLSSKSRSYSFYCHSSFDSGHHKAHVHQVRGQTKNDSKTSMKKQIHQGYNCFSWIRARERCL